MIKSITTLVVVLFVQNLFAQDIYVTTGHNITSIYMSNSDNPLLKTSNKISNPGNFYEVGMVFNENSPEVAYSVGLSYNEYNTSYYVSGTAIRYDWQTEYIGIQNSLVYDLLNSDSRENTFQINTKLGLNTAVYIKGYQNANGTHYTITNSPDFRRFILQPYGGLQLAFRVSNNCKFNAGYQLSIANIGKDQGGSFNYINQQLQVGFSFSIN